MFRPFKRKTPPRPKPAVATNQPPTQPPIPRVVHLTGETMGTRYQVACVPPPGTDIAALGARVQAATDAVDAQMSTWKPASPLSRFNRTAPGDWVAVPPDLARVVLAGQTLARQTAGAFDITVGAAVALWGFGPEARTPPPPETATAAARGRHGALAARLSPPGLRKSCPLAVDLSGIAKGFGVDQIARVLEADAITDYFVVIDGEVRLSGRKPGLDGAWRLALEAPVAGRREVYDILQPPPPCALATSGDYRHFHRQGGRSFSHTIDGRSGRPVDNAIGSVTVAQESCMMADAWATALLVLGPREGVALAQARNITARFLIREGAAGIDSEKAVLRDVMTGDFAAIIG